MTSAPDYLLFAQHGWADTNHAIAQLATQLAAPSARVIAPDLGWLNTWLRFEPLVAKVEAIATAELARYPDAPLRIIGHSMGGLIWVELLARHPDWRARVHSLVLVASPLGGADIAHLLARFSCIASIAEPLSANRRPLAEAIAREVPTLTITGDIDQGSDGTVIVEATQCAYARAATLPVGHAQLKNHPELLPTIRAFWAAPQVGSPPVRSLQRELIGRLRSLPRCFDAHRRDFAKATPLLRFPDGSTLSTWQQPWLKLEHVFLSDARGNFCFGGFFSGRQSQGLLAQEIAAIAADYQGEWLGDRAIAAIAAD